MARIYRRGKIYWGRVQRQGREYRRSLKTADRAIAEKRFRQWTGDLDAIAWGDQPRRTFEETAARFINEHLTILKPRSATRYGNSLKHLSEHFAGKTLDRINTAELSTFETKRRTQSVTAGTIRRDLACLSSLLSSAIEWEWIEVNPVPGYLRRRAKRGLKEAPGRTRYLSIEEEARLLAHATPAVRDAITLAIDTGLRSGELFGLEWKQIDMVRGLIDTTTKTKSGRARRVPLPERSRTIVGTPVRRIDSPYVLTNPDTGTRYIQMSKGLAGARRRAGVANLRWHDLRRTAACRWLQRDGKTMAEVSMLLGHSSVTVTEQRYAFLDADAVAESLASRTNVVTGQRTANEIA